MIAGDILMIRKKKALYLTFSLLKRQWMKPPSLPRLSEMSKVATFLYPCAQSLSTNEKFPSFAPPTMRSHFPGRISTVHLLLSSLRHRRITLRCSSDQAAGEQSGDENQNLQVLLFSLYFCSFYLSNDF